MSLENNVGDEISDQCQHPVAIVANMSRVIRKAIRTQISAILAKEQDQKQGLGIEDSHFLNQLQPRKQSW